MGEVRYVRMRSVDERAGCVKRKISVRWKGEFFGFQAPDAPSVAGWSIVPKEFADVLATKRQIEKNPNSQPVFQVCTEEEAHAVDMKLRAEREAKKKIEEPTVESARDLTASIPGRGDLGLEAVTEKPERRAALDAVAARASGVAEPVEPPEPIVEPPQPPSAPTEPEPEPEPKPKAKKTAARSTRKTAPKKKAPVKKAAPKRKASKKSTARKTKSSARRKK
jgi:hypothetical protein